MRKFIWGLLGVAFVAGLIYLSFNSSKTLATTNGGHVTEAQYYSSIKTSATGQQLFAQMVIDKVLQSKYGSTVTDNVVNNAYALQRAQYGGTFQSFLSANNQTEESYLAQIRSNLLLEQAILNNYDISESDLKDALADYTPSVEVSMIPVNDQDTANKVVDQANGGTSFDSLAKQYSTDSASSKNGGKVAPFDSNSPQISSDLMKLINDTEVGKVASIQTDTGWLVIKVDKKAKKSDNANDYKPQLQLAVVKKFMSDDANQKKIQDIIGKIMRSSNVQVKDRELAPAVAQYLKTEKSSSSK